MPVIVAILLLGGFFRSLQFTSVNAIAFADVEPNRGQPRHRVDRRRPAALAVVRRRFRGARGRDRAAIKGKTMLEAADFPPAFIVVALISATSILLFSRLPADAGAEMADRVRGPRAAADQRAA